MFKLSDLPLLSLKSPSILMVPVPVNLPMLCSVDLSSLSVFSLLKSSVPLFILSVPSILAPDSKASSPLMLVVPSPETSLPSVPERFKVPPSLLAIVPFRFSAAEVKVPLLVTSPEIVPVLTASAPDWLSKLPSVPPFPFSSLPALVTVPEISALLVRFPVLADMVTSCSILAVLVTVPEMVVVPLPDTALLLVPPVKVSLPALAIAESALFRAILSAAVVKEPLSAIVIAFCLIEPFSPLVTVPEIVVVPLPVMAPVLVPVP